MNYICKIYNGEGNLKTSFPVESTTASAAFEGIKKVLSFNLGDKIQIISLNPSKSQEIIILSYIFGLSYGNKSFIKE